jgi:hypothetical protein
MEENINVNDYIQYGVLKDEIIVDCLGLNNTNELKEKAPKILNQLNEDKTSIEKNIIYNLANLEMAIRSYQEIQNQSTKLKLETEDENNNVKELVGSTVKKFVEQLESCQDDLTIVNKAIEIVNRYNFK